MPSRHLTKSRYIAGLQCLRRLWREVNEPRAYEEPPFGSPLANGIEVGQAAHRLFPDGMLVTEPPWQHAEAVQTTRALMADPAVPAIFEAAFEHENVRIRVDVLERLDGATWGLREVKASTRVKDHYLDDLAIQHFVLMGSGVRVASIELLHINTGYVRGAGEVCWPAFFVRADVTEQACARLPDLAERLRPMWDALACDASPSVEPGGHCTSPYGCTFWEDCIAAKPSDWIAYLPRLSGKRAEALAQLGIDSISAIPAGFPLSWQQEIIREVLVTGRPYVSPDLPRLLRGFGPPAAYLDFEAMMPPIPLYEGTSPYQVLPFQWSLHEMDEAGGLSHREYLAPSDRDPRRGFAESLIQALAGSEHPVLVYSGYEATRLRELAAQFPDLAEGIEAIIGRLMDLLPLVRNAVYFPAFGFSNSIKSVAPALQPDFGYADLGEVADGAAAASAFLQLACGQVEDPVPVRTALVAYCERDTLAMVEVHRALLRLADTVSGQPEAAAPSL